MRDLIYFFVRAHEYRLMLVECIKSLRGPGKFTGDILVFTESLCPIMSALAACGVEVLVADWMRTSPIMLDRVVAAQHIRFPQRYRTITLLDSDILAFNDIAPLISDENHVRFMEEPWQTYGQLAAGHPTDMYLSAMSADERVRCASKNPINVGHVTWPGHTHRELLAAWLATLAGSPQVWGADQASFNAIIRRDLFASRPYEPHDVGNASFIPEQDWNRFSLIHFAGYGNRLAKMQEMNR